MSHEAAAKFLGSISQDIVDQAKGDAVTTFVAAGKAAGYDFTAKELGEVAAAIQRSQLSDEDLDRVAGGVPGTVPIGSLGPLGLAAINLLNTST